MSEEVRQFATKIRNGMDPEFTFLNMTWMEPTNNRGERALRVYVVQREIIGCISNGKGIGIYEMVMTVLASWKQQGHNLSKTPCEILTLECTELNI